jgi:murein DD-endopeptidase MepM/ murein hydrolase activator NlpD
MKLVLSCRPSLLVVSNLLLSLSLLLILSFYKINAPIPTKYYAESKTINPILERQPAMEDHPASGFVFYDLPLPEWTKGFLMPIDGAEVPQNIEQLPGAARGYRNGRHEGVDIYCAYGTPVLAAKDGYVLSVGADYHDLSKASRDRLLGIAKNLISTPAEVTDILHGRRVILDHGISSGRWVVTVYSHLSEVKNLVVYNFLCKFIKCQKR